MKGPSKESKVASSPNAEGDDSQPAERNDFEIEPNDNFPGDEKALPSPSIRPSVQLQAHGRGRGNLIASLGKPKNLQEKRSKRGRIQKKGSGKALCYKRKIRKHGALALPCSTSSAGAEPDIVDLVSDSGDEQPLLKVERATAPIPERNFTVLSVDELASIRLAFIEFFPTPPSNMQVQGRYEAIHGNSMSAEMVQRIWEQTLKPWSERWWELYHNFNNVVRKKNLEKPRNRDPTIEEDEVFEWAKSFCAKYGNPEPRSKPFESLWDGLKHR